MHTPLKNSQPLVTPTSPAWCLLMRTVSFTTPPNSQHIKQIINQHPKTLFIVFMAIANIHFDEYLLVRKNLLISSKSIKPESLDDILGDYLNKEVKNVGRLTYPTIIKQN